MGYGGKGEMHWGPPGKGGMGWGWDWGGPGGGKGGWGWDWGKGGFGKGGFGPDGYGGGKGGGGAPGKGGAYGGGKGGSYGAGGGGVYGGGRGGGKGGGGGYGATEHDYRRMEGDDAPVDLARVNELLSLRVCAKRAGDFRAADRMRNELRSLGVAVLDREREWHVIGGDGMGRPDGGSEPYGGYGGAHNMSERFGETGHDYRRDDDGTVNVDESRVNEMLAARLHARLNRDFVAADRLRDQVRSNQTRLGSLSVLSAHNGPYPSAPHYPLCASQLRREHGVEVFDQERVWRPAVSDVPAPHARHREGDVGGRFDRRGAARDDEAEGDEDARTGLS
jgi:hypothetical protein